jgi:hypothetical protein
VYPLFYLTPVMWGIIALKQKIHSRRSPYFVIPTKAAWRMSRSL